MERKDVTKNIRNLKIGEKTDFDIIQYDSVKGAIQRIQTKHKREGCRWSTSVIETTIEVTRTA